MTEPLGGDGLCYAVGYRDPKTGMWKRVWPPIGRSASKAECQIEYLRLCGIYGITTAVLGPVDPG